ncbi:endonuclease VII domain-containing protein [Allonocardiopsis opalescens]|uniref:Recombination endonuclease VII n=1 Tax=Allonocardiopsis opalescens TaxID=1144618 RepID=A0A2T0PTX0_9ACTN|nr:endonuclease VII domain-containing protein [Allonocardiopsis opalescens]PRX92349.1 recombination endonuclease VII [Allonocardiopsis opalescens]
MDLKKCRDCGVAKELAQFWKMQAAPDGLSYYCIDCAAERNRRGKENRARRQEKTYTPQGRRRVLAEGEKWCPKCERALPRSEFGSNRSSRDGLTAYCRPCHNRIGRENRERNHGGTRHYHLKRRYGIGADDAERMLAEQGGVCLICHRELGVENMHVDHSHTTGEVRGILCFNCNGGLGQFKDDHERMLRAITYLDARMRPSLARRGAVSCRCSLTAVPGRERVRRLCGDHAPAHTVVRPQLIGWGSAKPHRRREAE